MNTIIRYFKDKINSLAELLVRRDIFLVILIVGVGVCSFTLGYLARGPGSPQPITFSQNLCLPPVTQDSVAQGAALAQGSSTIVASKNGTRYYYVWCSGVSRIADKNKVFFSSESEARQKGYTLASGCK